MNLDDYLKQFGGKFGKLWSTRYEGYDQWATYTQTEKNEEAKDFIRQMVTSVLGEMKMEKKSQMPYAKKMSITEGFKTESIVQGYNQAVEELNSRIDAFLGEQ